MLHKNQSLFHQGVLEGHDTNADQHIHFLQQLEYASTAKILLEIIVLINGQSIQIEIKSILIIS